MRKNIQKIDLAIGEELRKMRERMGLTLEDVALRMNTTKGSIHMYETGRNSIPIKKLMKMCTIYNSSYIVVLERVKQLVD